MKILILYGSYRHDRQGIKLTAFFDRHLKERGHESIILDAAKYEFTILERMYKEYEKGSAPAWMEGIAEHIRTCDGILVVAGEYNHSVQPGLKNMMDHFLEEWKFKPSAICCYSAGGFGGVRVAMHLRAVLCELGMSSIPSLFPVSGIYGSIDENGDVVEGKYDERVKKFLDEFDWYMRALKGERDQGTPY